MLTRGRLAIAVAAIFVPVLWLAATATGGKAPTGGTPLYPDLRSAVPHHFTVQNNQQEEWLRFSNLIANTGQGGLRLRPEHDLQTNVTTGFQEVSDANGNIVVDQAVSEFVFHPQHNHWHMQAVATFEIRTALDDGTRGRMGPVWANQSQKTSFCLIDVIKLEGNSNTTDRTYWDCFPTSTRASRRAGATSTTTSSRGRSSRSPGRRQASTTWCRSRTPRGATSRPRRPTTPPGRASG